MTTKKCPWCAEEILLEAKKCKHCGEFLEPSDARSPEAAPPPLPAVHACETCGAHLGSARELYLHRVNQHNQMDTVPSSNAARGGARDANNRREPPGARIVCPHCHARGHVRTKTVKLKKGISGGKATGAVLTAGISILATGLSRKEKATEAHCLNCNVTWYV